jgi:hypothetical protein
VTDPIFKKPSKQTKAPESLPHHIPFDLGTLQSILPSRTKTLEQSQLETSCLPTSETGAGRKGKWVLFQIPTMTLKNSNHIIAFQVQTVAFMAC